MIFYFLGYVSTAAIMTTFSNHTNNNCNVPKADYSPNLGIGCFEIIFKGRMPEEKLSFIDESKYLEKYWVFTGLKYRHLNTFNN